MSGINHKGFHPILWYRRSFTDNARASGRLILHFGAVDYRVQVWVNGDLVATHEGGHTPFSADITASLRKTGEQVIVVRAEETGDGDDAVAAGAVLDDDRLVPHRRELVGEQAGADVDAAAGPERDDEMHRSRRPGVGGEAGLCRQTGDGERGCEQQGAVARNESCHEILPSRSGFLV